MEEVKAKRNLRLQVSALKSISKTAILASSLFLVSLGILLYGVSFTTDLSIIENLVYILALYSFLSGMLILIFGRKITGRDNRVFAALLASLSVTFNFFVIYLLAKFKYIEAFSTSSLLQSIAADFVAYTTYSVFFVMIFFFIISIIEVIAYLTYNHQNKKLIEAIERTKVEYDDEQLKMTAGIQMVVDDKKIINLNKKRTKKNKKK